MSDFTQEQKKKILERDNYQCRFGKFWHIFELTGVPCSEELEVHHLVYRRDRQFLKDGVTVCVRCHEWFLTCFNRYIKHEERAKRMDLNGVLGFERIKM